MNKFGNLSDHLLFSNLIDNQIDPKELGKIIAPFYFAIEKWKQTLDMFKEMLHQYPNFQKLIQNNIDDEMGKSLGEETEKPHTVTFLEFLVALNYNDFPTESDIVNIFNQQISNQLSTEKDISKISYFLGSLENFYSEISKCIQMYCEKNKIHQVHYNEHSDMDKDHAAAFFEIAQFLGIHDKDIEEMNNLGKALLCDVFENLYRDCVDKTKF